MSQTAYIVIVYPAPPATRGDVNNSYSYDRHQPRVAMATASSAEEAAKLTKVPPGGHAYVVEKRHATRFSKAKEAPLIAEEMAPHV